MSGAAWSGEVRRSLTALALAGAVLVCAGCASTPASDPRDPFENLNRATYKLNKTLDDAILKPVAQGYNTVLPQPVRTCVSNIFANIGDLPIAANNLLEGNIADAASDACRVLINTTIGLAGCIDVATKTGLSKHHKDFGITLGTWGVGPGPYLVLPFFGPSDLRDSAGLLVDLEIDPLGYLYPVWQRNTIEGVRIIDTRASLIGAGNLLQSAALDEYVFLRDGYLSRRRYQIYNGNPPDEENEDKVQNQ